MSPDEEGCDVSPDEEGCDVSPDEEGCDVLRAMRLRCVTRPEEIYHTFLNKIIAMHDSFCSNIFSIIKKHEIAH